MKNIHFKNEEGFTLLFATLVAALILSIGIAIANITLLQLVLSSAGKESQSAFYNADSGIECALYYEYNEKRLDNVSAFFSNAGVAPDQNIVCEGKIAQNVSVATVSGTTTTTFMINPPTAGCTTRDDPTYIVSVGRKSINAYSSSVYIESRGYNTCDTNSLRRVERGLYVKLID